MGAASHWQTNGVGQRTGNPQWLHGSDCEVLTPHKGGTVMDFISTSDTLAALYRLALSCLQTSCHCFYDMEGAESFLPH